MTPEQIARIKPEITQVRSYCVLLDRTGQRSVAYRVGVYRTILWSVNAARDIWAWTPRDEKVEYPHCDAVEDRWIDR